MKKALLLFLSVLVLAGVVGCSAPPPQNETPEKENPAAETPAAEIQKEEETTPEDVSDVATLAPIPKEELLIGIIHITDPSEGSGYTYTHDVGIQKMQQAIGLEDNQIIRKNNVKDSDPTAIQSAIQECVEEGANVIFATSWGYMDIVEAMAEEYPDVYFLHGTGYKKNDTNFSNYFGRIYQARYLSGIVAGLTTKTDKIGFVGAMGKENSEVTGGINAFALGVESVNPDAKIYVKVTNSWFSPEEETNAAKALIAEGCDVIGQHCDTPNPQLEAEKSGVFGIGYNSDMSKDAPNATLTSVMWNWEVFYTDTIERIMAGTWNTDIYYGGMAEGLVKIAPLAEFASPEAQGKVDEATTKILSGELGVFDGELKTNTGETVGQAGETLSDADITGAMNWYYHNVEEK